MTNSRISGGEADISPQQNGGGESDTSKGDTVHVRLTQLREKVAKASAEKRHLEATVKRLKVKSSEPSRGSSPDAPPLPSRLLPRRAGQQPREPRCGPLDENLQPLGSHGKEWDVMSGYDALAEFMHEEGFSERFSEDSQLPSPSPEQGDEQRKVVAAEIVHTRKTLTQLMEKVSSLCVDGPVSPGHQLSRNPSSEHSPRIVFSGGKWSSQSSDPYRISRDTSVESTSRSGNKKVTFTKVLELETDDTSDREARDIVREDVEAPHSRKVRRTSTANSANSAEGSNFATRIWEEDGLARTSENADILADSLATKAPALQGAIYLLALGGVVFTLV
jgi:hypothetical protein